MRLTQHGAPTISVLDAIPGAKAGSVFSFIALMSWDGTYAVHGPPSADPAGRPGCAAGIRLPSCPRAPLPASHGPPERVPRPAGRRRTGTAAGWRALHGFPQSRD
ncbi:hypothetical protein GCM10010387_24320 [Streptomyces inusitatus]|uniref:Uncharacterized protein n=1 Tax=Streptomyces inusitatus TaxID=68221 RepID=A0A918Q3H3_9ACTN|nr:hypothetical protein GCM10010387_24320 [Streptomyces inusitatus]